MSQKKPLNKKVIVLCNATNKYCKDRKKKHQLSIFLINFQKLKSSEFKNRDMYFNLKNVIILFCQYVFAMLQNAFWRLRINPTIFVFEGFSVSCNIRNNPVH